MRKKSKALVVAMCALVLALGVNATIAWLTDKTEAVENTFTVGDINITLTETDSADADADADKNSYKMVPGNEIVKDPTVTVLKNSEDCWLFVKVEASANLGTYIDYEMESGWTPLVDGNGDGWADDGVYYREVDADAADQVFDVIGYQKDASTFVVDKVLVKTSVTKAQMEAIDGKNADGSANTAEVQPTLTFTAYAVQKDNIATAAAAWAEVSPQQGQ